MITPKFKGEKVCFDFPCYAYTVGRLHFSYECILFSFLCMVIKHTLCECDTTHRDTGVTTITPTNKAINNITIATINKLMATDKCLKFHYNIHMIQC